MKRMYFAVFILVFGLYSYSQNYPENWIKVQNIDGLFGFIDIKTGDQIVFCLFENIEDFGVIKEDWALVTEEGLYGIINSKGEVVLGTMYEEIGFFDKKTNLAIIKQDGFLGLINENGEIVVQPEYLEIDINRTNYK